MKQISLLALLSLLLGIAAIPLQMAAGLPALVIGYVAMRRINLGDNQQKGMLVALLGMFLGIVGCLITILGVVFVSFSSLWETSSRVNCSNNLRFLGQSTFMFHDVHGEFPRAARNQPGIAVNDRLSWMTHVEFDPVKKSVTPGRWGFKPEEGWITGANQAIGMTRVGAFVCPASNHPRGQDGLSWTSYVGQSGVGKDSAMLPKGHERAGYMGYERSLKRDDITRGTAEFLLVVETCRENGPWIAAGASTVRPLADTGDCIGPGRAFGGLHGHGVSSLMGDGATRFISDRVNFNVFQAMFLVQ